MFLSIVHCMKCKARWSWDPSPGFSESSCLLSTRLPWVGLILICSISTLVKTTFALIKGSTSTIEMCGDSLGQFGPNLKIGAVYSLIVAYLFSIILRKISLEMPIWSDLYEYHSCRLWLGHGTLPASCPSSKICPSHV